MTGSPLGVGDVAPELGPPRPVLADAEPIGELLAAGGVAVGEGWLVHAASASIAASN